MSKLPRDWRRSDLASLGAEAQTGFASGANNRSGNGIVHLRPMNVTRIGSLDLTDVKYVEDESERRVRSGDVLFNNTNSPALVGKTAFISVAEPMAYSNHMTRLRFPSDSVCPKFMAHQLQWLWMTGLFERICSNHVNQASVAGKRLLSVEVVLPPLEEQRRIVAILEEHLSHLNAASEGLRKATSQLVQFEKSELQAATRSVPFNLMPLMDVLMRVEAGKSFACEPRPSQPGEWGVIKVSAMTWGRFKEEENKAVPLGKSIDERYRIRAGDVLVSRANTSAYVGSPVLVEREPDRLVLSDKSLRLTPRVGIRPDWMIAVLSAPSTREQISRLATGTKDSMRNITQESLLSVLVPVPVSDVGQRAVVARAEATLGASGRLKHDLKGAQSRGDGLRRSILAAAFSGQLTEGSRV